MEPLYLLLVFAAGTLSGIINVMAGGGSALTLPLLIFLGLDGAMANGTNRIAIFVQSIFAVWSFRQQKMHQFRESLRLSAWTLPGGVLGALAALKIGDEWFERILAIVLIWVIISMFASPGNRSGAAGPPDLRRRWLVYPAMLAIGFYGGFIQVGVGFMLMAALFHLLKMNLVEVNMHKVFIVMIFTIPALAIFIIGGKVDWWWGLSLAAGNSLGGWWAARVSVKKGERVIRWVLFAAMLLMAARLLGVF
ncbi:MAG: sulfite exporter TauE/SafE family protein [Calditrichaceae bacterium]|nr:sulfite exporter TauE/SafE family protein [Calditrichia bacterium]NUQ41548.1 sulfite exporter TauE/SafE family protein [Calditrichaceae bacterium]